MRQQVIGHTELRAETGQKFLLPCVRKVGHQARRRDDLRGQLRVAGDAADNLSGAHRMGNSIVEKRALVGTEAGPLHCATRVARCAGSIVPSALAVATIALTISCAVS